MAWRNVLMVAVATSACLLWAVLALAQEGGIPSAAEGAARGSPPAPSGTGEPNTGAKHGAKADRNKPALVSAEEIRANESGDGIWDIIGHVEVVQDKTTMRSDYCKWNRNANTALFTGGVQIVDEQNVITSERCEVNFDKEEATLTENVKVVSQNAKKPAGEKPNKDTDTYEYGKWTTTCERIVYNYGNDTGRAEGNIVSVSEDNEYTLRTTLAEYMVDEKDNEVITLPANPTVTTPEGEQFTCQKAVITVPPEEGTKCNFYGVRGKVLPDQHKEKKKGTQPAPTPPPGPQPSVTPGSGPGFGGAGGAPAGGTTPPPPGGTTPPPSGGTTPPPTTPPAGGP